MSVTVFSPKDVEVGPIGSVMAEKVSDEGLKDFFREKDKIDRNLSAVLVDDSPAMGVGVGTWEPGQKTNKPIPLMFDEVLFIVSGEIVITIDGVETRVNEGDVAHLPAKQMVMFRSDSGCRLVWVTSPPTWKAIEAAWVAGVIPKPGA
ncbi:MAG: cupin domain-containing protein [Pseudomonadota bacterium]